MFEVVPTQSTKQHAFFLRTDHSERRQFEAGAIAAFCFGAVELLIGAVHPQCGRRTHPLRRKSTAHTDRDGQGRPAQEGDTAQDVRLLATLVTWTILGYVPTERTPLPRALGPIELALLRVSITATHTPPTAAEFGDRLSTAAQRARTVRSWLITAGAVGVVVVALALARFVAAG